MNNFNDNNVILDMEFMLKTSNYVVKKKYKDEYLYFMECTKSEARRMVEYGHYSHRFIDSFGRINVGVYYQGRLLGVASFGYMLNPNSYKKFGSKFVKGSIIELNRMWVDDELGKNTESMLLSASIKIIKELYTEVKLIQSFSDGRLGCGIMYQASNFKYYGYHATVFLQDKQGVSYHLMSLTSTKNSNCKLLRKYLCDELTIIRVKTYRYIYCLDKNYECEMTEFEYPKSEGSVEYLNKIPDEKSMLERYLKKELLDTDLIDMILSRL